MSVVSRTFRSSPHRDAATTWAEIVELLTQGRQASARSELLAVSGIASSTIADRSPADAAIVVTCDGPRTRIYCVYDDDALDESTGNDSALGFDPLNGDWHVSLPCQPDDLSWVQRALAVHSERVTARDVASTLSESAAASNNIGPVPLVFDRKGFLGS
jgi:hypothetical protein